MVKTHSIYWLFVTGILLILSLFAQQTLADSLTVSSDRQEVEEGDVVSLYVEADFQTLGNQLEYDVLDTDFEVLSRQRSNFYQVINGQQAAKTRWHLRVLPKKTGLLTVPPLKLGKVESQPYQLKVRSTEPLPQGTVPTDFIEVSLSQKQVYVQQEVLYTMRFYHQGKLISGNILPPTFGDSIIDTLRDEKVYDKLIDGKYYTVYEWIYAFYPQSSGEMLLKAPEFTGLVQRDRRQKAITEKGQDLSLQVLPIAKDFPDPQHWLPAKAVLLKQEWKNLPQKIRVGDSLTRVITLQVFGQKANQLPQITTESGKGFKVYKQKPLTQEEKLADGMISRIEMIQTIVPTEAGTLTLPEQKIYWWNIQTNSLETLYLEKRLFDIQPGMVQPDYARAGELVDTKEPFPPVEPAQSSSSLWLWISLLLALGLALSLAGWFWHVKHLKSTLKASNIEKNSIKTHKASIDWCQLPAMEFYRKLQHYCHNQWQLSPKQLFTKNEDIALFNALEKHLFAQGDWQESQQKILCESLKKWQPTDRQKPKHSNKTELAALYGDKTKTGM